MSRIRSIKPEHWNDKELPNISLQAQLLWIGMWNFSDDDGIMEADPLLIRSQVFPRRTDIRMEQMEQWLGQLVSARFVIPFEYNGSGYYIHRTFKTHQKIEKSKPSKIPKELIENVLKSKNKDSPTIPRLFPDGSATDHLPITAREERRGIGEEGRGEDALPPNPEFLGNVIFDIEKYLSEHRKDFEIVCMDAKKTEDQVLFVLKKFHLWNQQNEKYPKPPLALIAGLKSWLLKEQNFVNGTHQQQSGKSNPRTAGVNKLLKNLKDDIAAGGRSDNQG